jgi:hypothetical protein
MPVALAKGIVTNLVARRACPFMNPWLRIVTIIGKLAVISIGIN